MSQKLSFIFRRTGLAVNPSARETATLDGVVVGFLSNYGAPEGSPCDPYEDWFAFDADCNPLNDVGFDTVKDARQALCKHVIRERRRLAA